MKPGHVLKNRDKKMPNKFIVPPWTIFMIFLLMSVHSPAFGAVGCDLNDPDRDVARLFPQSTGYKAIYASITKNDGGKLIDAVEERLGDRNHRDYWGLYDSYTIYEILSGKKKIGYIHGVNQKGQFGGLQVFLVLDLEGVIKGFYIQKMTNQYAAKFRDANFGKQFTSLTIKDFDQYDVITKKTSGKVEEIKNPVPEAETDFTAIIRAAKKNLILMDVFVYSAKTQLTTKERTIK
jgi:hypothetical protein